MFRKEVKVFFSDCDPAGILFFANIFKLAHSVYEEFILECDPRGELFEAEGTIVPLIHSEADFLRPIKLHETIIVNLIVTKLKEASFELTYEFENSKGELAAKVKTAHIFVSKSDFSKREIPKRYLEHFTSHLYQQG